MAAGQRRSRPFLHIALFATSAAVFATSLGLLIWSFSLPIPELYRWKNERAESGRIILYRGSLCFTRLKVREDLSVAEIQWLKERKSFDGLCEGVEGYTGILGFYWHESRETWNVSDIDVVPMEEVMSQPFKNEYVIVKTTDPLPHRKYQRLDIALWPAIFLSCVFAGLAGWRYRIQSLGAEFGLCSKCRYDLRGNVSGRCPECGTTIHEEERRQKV